VKQQESKDGKMLIKTHIADHVGRKLEAEANRRGLTLLEYVRWVLGEHASSLAEPEHPGGRKTKDSK
jgi:hypothetical protein